VSAASPERTELIEYHEFHLEDIDEGLIALDRVLKLVGRDVTGLPISRNQRISIIFYIASAVARDVDRLESVKGELPPEAVAQLDQYAQRLQRRSENVITLKLTGLSD
jgi:hypothetical protein